MIGFLIAQGAIILGTYVYHRWIEEHPPGPRPRDISLPVVDEGTPIPLIYGRCRVRAPVLAWAGNFTVPDPPTTTIYKLEMLFVIGVPFFGGYAALGTDFSGSGAGGLYYGDVVVGALHTGTLGGTAIYSGALGGAITDVNIVGVFYSGTPTQDVNDGTPAPGSGDSARSSMIFAGVSPTLIPGFRSMVAFWGQFHIGQTPNIASIGFDVSSLSTGTASDLGQSLAEEADPAAVIYDLLTSPWGKLSLPTSKIDIPSFQAASLTLFNEVHGYSRVIEQSEDASEIIADVLRQIDGVLYEEPTTGKLVLKLIRADYNVNDLDDINPDNAESPGPGWYSVQGWSETFNQVRVTWTNRVINYADGLAIGQNMANAVGQGGKLRSTDMRFIGCCTSELAQKLASRELAVASRPMVKATVTVNRNFYETRPGAVVTLTWPELGVSKMVMRVARVDLGQLHDGRITLDMIRDIFDTGLAAFPSA